MVSQRSGRSLLSIPLPLSETYTGTATVIVDEFDASGFQCTPDGYVVWRRHRCLSLSKLGAPNRGYPYC
jgi:hypothetical protein